MQSLAHIDVIDGRPSPSAELLNRLIREAGHTIEVVESNDKICTLKGNPEGHRGIARTLVLDRGCDESRTHVPAGVEGLPR